MQTVPTREPPLTLVRCTNEQGFSLHAAVCCAAHQREKREHLCRYITCPAIANERLALNRAGQVVLTLKTPYRDGTTHLVMSPLEFMQATRYAGSPSAVASDPLPWGARRRQAASRGHSERAGQRQYPLSGSRDAPPPSASARLSCARLLKRVFDIDLEYCPHCVGPFKIIVAIVDSTVIAKTHPSRLARPWHRPDPRRGDSTDSQ
ncbi:MAG: transposase [Anaerolineales bacterium]